MMPVIPEIAEDKQRNGVLFVTKTGNFRSPRELAALFLCSTLLSSICFPAVSYAATGPGSGASHRISKPKAAVVAPLAAELRDALASALRQSKAGLLAQVFDSVHSRPDLRDAVLVQARGLAPALSRDLTTAADLGVLTAGQKLTLAPTSERMLQTRSADGIGASAYAIATRANNTSPNLPSPPPSLYTQTWHLDMIGASVAYTRGFTGAGVTVAVGDSGFDVTNAALINKLNIALARNYVVKDGTVYDPTQLTPLQSKEPDNHGTHVAGIIAAQKFDNVDAHGVAYDATVIPIRAVGDVGYSYAEGIDGGAAPLEYFASLSGVMVYNASYGPNRPAGVPPQTSWLKTLPTSDAEIQAIMNVLKAGKIIVAANGNDREADPVAARNPNGMALYPFLQPGHADTGVYLDGGDIKTDLTEMLHQNGLIIGVMSLDENKQPAYYSNYCGVTASWCVAAPGGDMKNGLGVYSTIAGNTYGQLQGTSMAAPTVSGAIAVLIQANPTYNAQDLAHLLFSTTEDLGLPGVDAVYGYGLIRLDRATDGPTVLAAGSSVSVAAGDTTYWSQLLNTSGGFTKDGDGILTIAGRTNAAGNVFAALGTLAVDGTLSMASGSSLSIAQPATLAGFGTINGNTSIAGTLSPGKMANTVDLIANGVITPGATLLGNSVGMLTFNGNVTLASTATTRIDIDGSLNVPGGPGTYDRIFVSGAGNVFYANGALIPVLRGSVGTASNYTPAIGTEFAFVQAQDGARAAGTFSSLQQPVSGLPANGRFDLIYAPTAITLAVTPLSFANLTGGNKPASATERAVAGILDSERAGPGVMPTAAEKALYDALYNLDTEAQYDKALAQLGGPGQPAVATASLQAFQGFMGAMGDRQDALSLGAAQGQAGSGQSFALSYAGRTAIADTGNAMNAFASLQPAERVQVGWSLWGQGFGRSSKVGDAGELSGSKTTSGGFTVGADRMVSANLIAGGAFGYARTSSTSTDIRGTSDSYAGALYASWTPGAAVIDIRAAAGPSQIQTSRDLSIAPGTLQGSTSGIGAGVALEAGYRIPVAMLVFKPYAGLGWQGFRRDGYTESQQPFGLTFAAQTSQKLTSTLGMAVSARLQTLEGLTLVPELKLGWGHDLRDTTLISQAALLGESFDVAAASPGRDAALVGAKMSGWRTDNFRLFTAYNGEFRSNATSHQLSAGARYSW